ncbi:MAG: hypothetical protein RL264_2144 [Bacteroidota bacterium]
MNKLVFILFLFFLEMSCSISNFSKEELNMNTVQMINNDSMQNTLVFSGNIASLYIEKAIYRSSNEENLFLKFKLQNNSNKLVGLDLTQHQKIIFPNQWGFYPQPFRTTIDEERLILNKIEDSTDFVKKIKTNSLTLVQLNDVIEFYVEFNCNEEKIKKMDKNSFLIISLDGQITVTDGEQIEYMTTNSKSEAERTLIFNYPIISKTIPENSTLVKN